MASLSDYLQCTGIIVGSMYTINLLFHAYKADMLRIESKSLSFVTLGEVLNFGTKAETMKERGSSAGDISNVVTSGINEIADLYRRENNCLQNEIRYHMIKSFLPFYRMPKAR